MTMRSTECLRCRLLGRTGLACAHAAGCRDGRLHPLGPILVAMWLATAFAFVASVA